MMLNTLQCTGQPSVTKNYLIQNGINAANKTHYFKTFTVSSLVRSSVAQVKITEDGAFSKFGQFKNYVLPFLS